MSAIEDLRAALHGGIGTWSPEGMMKVDRHWTEGLLAEIDELKSEVNHWGTKAVNAETALAVARGERDYWQAARTGSSSPIIMGEVDFTPLEEWTADDVIAITPEQLVRIVREAGKP